MAELYLIPGYNDPVDVSSMTEEDKESFFRLYPESKQVKKNDPAVTNAETNVGSTTDTVLPSEDGSLGSQSAINDKLIQEFTLPQQDEDVVRNDASIEFDEISAGSLDNQISRQEEGDILAENLQTQSNSNTEFRDNLIGNGLGSLSKMFRQAASELVGGGYAGVTQLADKFKTLDNNIATSDGEIVTNNTYDSEKDRPSAFKADYQVVQPKDLTNYNIYNESRRTYARNKLRETQDFDSPSPVTTKDVDLYIEENENTKDFLQGTKTLFENEKVVKAKE